MRDSGYARTESGNTAPLQEPSGRKSACKPVWSRDCKRSDGNRGPERVGAGMARAPLARGHVRPEMRGGRKLRLGKPGDGT